MKRLGLGLSPVLLLVAFPANAHHGVASVGFAGAEGPGTALETTAALPLPRWTGFAMAKSEFVSFVAHELKNPMTSPNLVENDRKLFSYQRDKCLREKSHLKNDILKCFRPYCFAGAYPD